jgi:hypothetical protein
MLIRYPHRQRCLVSRPPFRVHGLSQDLQSGRYDPKTGKGGELAMKTLGFMAYAWHLYGIFMGYYGIFMGYLWHIYGIFTAYLWDMYRILYGICMGYV